MNENELSKKVNELEKQIELVQHRIQMLEDRSAIENLMARHQFYSAAQQGERIVDELWTSDENSASIEYGASGLYIGLWKVRTFYISEYIPGCLNIKSLSTQQIVVKDDWAEGSWIAIGIDLDAGELGPAKPGKEDQRQFLLSSQDSEGRRYKSEWQFQRIDAKFTRENNGWRIHNLHFREYFRSPYDQSPVEFARKRFETDGMWLESKFESPMPLPAIAHGENLPSSPTTNHWQYRYDADPRDLEHYENDVNQ